MKKQVFIVFTMVSLFVAAAAVSVYAQPDIRLVVTIPFEFAVGDKIMEAGEYIVSQRSYNRLLIQSQDSETALVLSITPTSAATTPDQSVLVFNRYSEQYFLSRVWTSGERTGSEISVSRAERELIRVRAEAEKIRPERQVVTIVARQRIF